LNDGGDSIFIGTNAGLVDDATSNNNLGIGINALISNTTGNQNVAVGNNSLITNIIGTDNTAIGKNTLQFNLASTNTAVGSYSQASASLGTFNNSIGTNSLFANSVGNFNVALGSSTLRLNTSGSNNTAVGTSTLFNNVTGSENTAIGSNAGRYFGSGTSANVDPSASVFIGRNTRANASGETNQIVIGMNALGLGSNTVVLGNDNIITTVLKGNVGIGTTSPSRKLSVEGSSSSIIADFKYSAAGYSSIDLSNNVSFARLSSVNSDLLLSPAGTERMRITSGGNVGIGTTTPNAKLDVSGSVNISGSGVQVPLQVSSGSTSLLFVSGSGNVGIGTTTPAAPLDVAGDVFINSNYTGANIAANDLTIGRTDTGNHGITIATGTTYEGSIYFGDSDNNDAGIIGYQHSTNSMKFTTNRSERMRITSAGNVGIGTASPAYKLDVNGDTNVNGTLTAIVKSFIIDHPTKQGKKLQYGVLEGPEHSVYVRGKLTNNNTITLPDHWTGLVHEDTITVNLTPIGRKQDLWVETVTDTTITVGSNNKINCFYTVFAERKDVDKLVTEFDKK
jgi:trimeric autotransporter adhesin